MQDSAPIKLLDPDIAAKIAAGEVVERPVSVVKELIENSLDAGATHIVVEVRGGGVDYIRVSDNGRGISSKEVELAFHRHATSKIANVEDLYAIKTLGFRGEALHSIAAVSCISLISCRIGMSIGYEGRFMWGQYMGGGSVGCPVGTSVTVNDVFGNQPARRKFLKTMSSEASRISDLVSRVALGFPEVRFQLSIEGRIALTTTGSGKLLDAITSVYGRKIASEMLQFVCEGTDCSAFGFVSPPSLARANRSYMTLFVNRRWIESRTLSFALAQSYHGLMADRRYPIAIVNLSVPYDEVDVNVHPSKREVRFHAESQLFSALQKGIREALVSSAPVPVVQFSVGKSSSPESENDKEPRILDWAGEWFGSKQSLPADVSKPAEIMPLIRILGQVKNTYVVAEGPDGLYLIDQHAAHERVLFEKLRHGFLANNLVVQPLLQPVVFDLSPAQDETLRGCLEPLNKYGFLIETFGDRSYLLRAVPAILTYAKEKALVDILDMERLEATLKDRQESLAASVACHGSVRGGMVLNQQEMEALVHQLGASENPHTCPHGRPTMIHISSYRLEREFGRK